MAEKLEIIEWFDESGQQIVQRIPATGSGTFKLGAQLIVRESQTAIFFRDGKALDAFPPGRHTLSTVNLPLITKLLSLPFGFESPFKAEAIFVNLKSFIDLKWGTAQPVVFRDSVLNLVRLRAHGIYSMRVSDPVLFVNKIVGTQGFYTTDMIEKYIKNIIVSRFNDLLGETTNTILDLPRYYDELAGGLKSRVKDDLSKSGVELIDLLVQAITPPEEVQKVIDEKSGMGAIGNLNEYLRFKAARAMEKASEGGAEGEGGAGSAGAGMGLGLGAGFGVMMPGMISEAMKQGGGQQPPGPGAAPAGPPCPKCNSPVPPGAKFCPECGNKMGPATMACPKCNAENPAASKFCSECGNKLSE
jgi:membrane protease subunit (stomatin/prohibitin family)